MRITIIGPGRMGLALAKALSEAGHRIDRLVGRNSADRDSQAVPWAPDLAIDSDLAFITTQDSEIEGTALQLAPHLTNRECVVFHTSGSVSSEAIGALGDSGISIGSFHPLVSISDPESGASRFAGSYFCLEGDPRAIRVGSGLIADLGGHAFSIPTDKKALYHASAVTACGHVVALLDIAFEMLSACGVEPDAAKDALLPLIESTVMNLSEQETHEALTGPYVRGDLKTIERHIDAIGPNLSLNSIQAYLTLAERSLEIAARRGASGASMNAIRDKILLAKSTFK